MAKKPGTPPSISSRHKSGVQRKAAKADVVHRLTHPKLRSQRGKIQANDPHSILLNAGYTPTQAKDKPPSIGARGSRNKPLIGSKPTPKKKVLRKKVASSRVRPAQRERGKRKLEQRKAEGRAR